MSRPVLLAPLSSGGALDRFDPRLRVLSVTLWTLSVLSLSSPALQGTAAAMALAVALGAGIKWRALLSRLLLLEGFMILVLVLMPFSLPGETLFTLGPLRASDAGLARALGILFTAHAVIFMVLALIGTLEVVRLGHTLGRLGLPDKLVHLFLFTVRYIQLLYDEYRRLRRAMRARGFVPASNRHSWNALGWLLGMLLVRSLERSARIHDAMKCRGFCGRFYLLADGRWQRQDTLAAIAWLPIVLILPLLEILQ